jgi:serine/threonine-protein kinase
MAPEQIRDAKHVGKAADIFSMGVTLYALLTGRLPFTGGSAFELMTSTVARPHVPVTNWRDVSPGLAKLIDTCLAKNPDHRYASAADLLRALEACKQVPQAEREHQHTAIEAFEYAPVHPGEQPAVVCDAQP